MVGKTISHYKVLEKIGQGGMGVVYKGIDTLLFRPVAIKVLSNDLCNNENSRQRFFHEARSTSLLNHPNICSIYEIGTENNLIYIVLEYLEGQTLKDFLLVNQPLPELMVVKLGTQLCDALNAAHKKGIIHRDIKPDNIIISPEKTLKVTDFGLAKWKDGNKVQREPLPKENRSKSDMKPLESSASLWLGTASYMSPEQILKQKLDERTDIFSAGIVLYELMTNTHPFAGPDSTTTMDKILNDPPAPMSDSRPGVSPQFQHIICKSLQKQANDRYPSAADMKNDLLGLIPPTHIRRFGLLNATGFLKAVKLSFLLIVPLLVFLAFTLTDSKNVENLLYGPLTDTGPHVARKDSICVIAVSPFWGSNTPGKQIGFNAQSIIKNQLKNLTLDLQGIKIIDGGFKEPLRSHSEAKKYGISAGADFIVWGVARLLEGKAEFDTYITFPDDRKVIKHQVKDLMIPNLSDRNQYQLFASQPEEIAEMCLYLTAIVLDYYGYRKKALLANRRIANRSYNIVIQESILLSKFDRDKAEKLLLDAIQQEPQRSSAYIALGRHYFGWKRYNDAINAITKAAALDTNNATIYDMRGQAYQHLGNYEKAFADYSRARYIDPLNAYAPEHLGMLYYEQGNFKQAVNYLKESIKLSPPRNLPDRLFKLANIYLENGDYNNAISYLLQTIKQNGRHSWAHHALAMAYLHKGNIQIAISKMETEIELYPERDVHYYGLGAIYFCNGEYEKAKKWFAAAVKMNKNNWTGHLLYYLSLLKMEQYSAAQQYIDLLKIHFSNSKLSAPIVQFYCGIIDEQEVLQRVQADKIINKRRDLCEAYYYIGMAYLLNVVSSNSSTVVNQQKAVDYFKNCVATKVRDYWEYELARAELFRLEQ